LRTKNSFLRNPSDTRDWDDAQEVDASHQGTSDRFALMFVKP
jgi:predicted methyltransferase